VWVDMADRGSPRLESLDGGCSVTGYTADLRQAVPNKFSGTRDRAPIVGLVYFYYSNLYSKMKKMAGVIEFIGVGNGNIGVGMDFLFQHSRSAQVFLSCYQTPFPLDVLDW